MPPKPPPPPVTRDTETVLRQQAESLQFLINEAKRIQQDITEHLYKLKHAGDPDKEAERRKSPRKRGS